jgi:hypothetical protein
MAEERGEVMAFHAITLRSDVRLLSLGHRMAFPALAVEADHLWAQAPTHGWLMSTFQDLLHAPPAKRSSVDETIPIHLQRYDRVSVIRAFVRLFLPITSAQCRCHFMGIVSTACPYF